MSVLTCHAAFHTLAPAAAPLSSAASCTSSAFDRPARMQAFDYNPWMVVRPFLVSLTVQGSCMLHSLRCFVILCLRCLFGRQAMLSGAVTWMVMAVASLRWCTHACTPHTPQHTPPLKPGQVALDLRFSLGTPVTIQICICVHTLATCICAVSPPWGW